VSTISEKLSKTSEDDDQWRRCALVSLITSCISHYTLWSNAKAFWITKSLFLYIGNSFVWASRDAVLHSFCWNTKQTLEKKTK